MAMESASFNSDLDASDGSKKGEENEQNSQVGEDSAVEKVASATKSSAEDDALDEQAELARRRELNRLSKIRCRKRRNDLIKSLQADVSRLAAEYHALRIENEQLRQEFLLCCMANGQGQLAQGDPAGFSVSQNPLNSNSIVTSPLLDATVSFGMPPQWASQQVANMVMASTAFNMANLVSSGNGATSGQSLTSSSASLGFPTNGDPSGYLSTASAQGFATNVDQIGYLGTVPAPRLSNSGVPSGFVGMANAQGNLGANAALGYLSNGSGYWGDTDDAARSSQQDEESNSGPKRKRDDES